MADAAAAVRWLMEATSNPDNYRLGDWTLPKLTPEQFSGKFPDLGKGAFGITLEVERRTGFDSNDVSILGQAKFYFNADSDPLKHANKESANLSSLNSRLIPKLYSLGTTPGSHQMPYVIMERIEGYDLSSGLKDPTSGKFNPLSATAFKTFAIDTLRALKYAHEKRVFHTDIKPANIMYSKLDDTYVIVDFGIARFLKRNELEGFVSGTEGYKAPEAYSEISAHKSDVYSLGLTYYFALTGSEPVRMAIAKHLVAKRDPGAEARVLRHGEYQQLISNLKFDYSGLPEDQRELLDRMLKPGFRDRADANELLELARGLQAGTRVFDAEANNPWSALLRKIEEELATRKLVDFRITVREKKHAGLWIKAVSDQSGTRLVCNRPKNPIGLSQLGWKNSSAGLMALELTAPLDLTNLAKIVLIALRDGFGIESPWTSTFG